MNEFSVKVPDRRLRLVSGEREPSAEPETPSGPATDQRRTLTAPWTRPRTQGAAAQGASRSPNTSPDLEYLAEKVLAHGYTALNELEDALTDSNPELAAVCCRKLSSIGELARLRGQSLERTPAS